MRHTPMSTNSTRGGAAALLIVVGALSLGAQSSGPVPARTRDSSAVMQVFLMTKGRIDTINMLMRSFEEVRAGSPMWDSVRKKIDALTLMPSRFEFRRPINPSTRLRGWIGVNAGGVPRHEEIRADGQVFITYFAYPTIVAVDGQSPAERAGIMPGDTLIAYNGMDVVGRALNLTRLLIPERKLGVTVRRDGEMKDFSVTVATAPDRVSIRRMAFDDDLPMWSSDAERGRVETEVGRAFSGGGARGRGAIIASPGFPPVIGNRMFVISPNGVLGASVSAVGPALAKILRLETGVLVNDVSEDTPAWKSGLRTGDVIINVGGQPVASLNQLRELIIMRAPEHAVPLRIIRDKKAQDLNVTW
ncbi:MAG TPA: PDZ domain-containing protein [Gemmatimonadaceae bacterium]|jgi:membrane-associated protease RseP (regulator of RpoE activity)|nr:PDZ domain-containing protein [Gemmatimonadaceae bacterium]